MVTQTGSILKLLRPERETMTKHMTRTRGSARRLLIGCVIAASAALMSACGDFGNAQTYTPQGEPDGTVIQLVRPHYVDLPDGRQVLCVYEAAYSSNGGGPSCDWPNARPNLAPKPVPAPANKDGKQCRQTVFRIFPCESDDKGDK